MRCIAARKGLKAEDVLGVYREEEVMGIEKIIEKYTSAITFFMDYIT